MLSDTYLTVRLHTKTITSIINAKVRTSPCPRDAEQHVHAFITSRLNSLNQLQLIHDTAGTVLTEQIKEPLVCFRIDFKRVNKCVYGLLPEYLGDRMLVKPSDLHTLCSSH